MPTQRRYSFGQNDDFSLEHRLVTQLSAAMRQEEHDNTHTDAHGDQQSTSTDHNSQIPDLSGLLGSLTSALGGSAATGAPADATTSAPDLARDAQHQQQQHQQQHPQHQHQQHQQQPHLDLGSQLDASNINASSLLALLGPAVSSTQQQQQQQTQSQQSQQPQQVSGQHEHRSASSITQGSTQPQTISHPGISQASSELGKSIEAPRSEHSSLQGIEGLNLDNLNSILAEARLPPSLPSTTTTAPAPSHSSLDQTRLSSVDSSQRHRDIGLSDLSEFRSTSIDPEVSSIQSVLQMLLTGGSATQSLQQPQQQQTTESESRTENAAAAGPSTSFTRLTGEPTQTESTDYSSLFGMRLGAEDQSLIESLRDAIGAASASSSSQSAAPSSAASTSSLMPSSSDISGRVQKPSLPKPRQKSRSSMKYPPTSSYKSYTSSDFNASDPETLRAIQQALLSALGPSAASTSLADSLTAATTAPSDGGVVFRKPTAELPIPASRRLHTTDTTGTSTTTTTTPRQPPSLLPGKFPSQKSGALEKGGLAAATSRASPKPAKPAELDKQKQREENAARKRKWRELNHLQNRDRDLRLRIVKRAHELYGESDTAEKNTWIEQEFNRRRHRRILRAGIHSIVESARARALKARESGASVDTGLERSSLGSARTLSQQSRQAASSHLSQLFRSSNAALEPQLHNEKLTVPLAPYMLVASPKRPPFKLQKLLQTAKNVSGRSQESATSTTPQSSTDPTAAPTSAPSSVEPSHPEPNETDVAPRTDSDQSKPDEVVIVKDTEKTAAAAAGDDDDHRGNSSNLLKDPDSEKDVLSSSSPHDDKTRDKTEKEQQKEEEQIAKSPTAQKPEDPPSKAKDNAKNDTQKDDAFADRPKHRYALVGKLSFGVPPNLTALYKKIRGFTPDEKLLHKA